MELRKNNFKYSYNSIFIKKLINGLSQAGKIQKIERALFQSLANLKFRVYLNPLVLFLFLLSEIKPCIVLRSLRLGSIVYQIPVPLVFRKQLFSSVKLLVNVIKTTRRPIALNQQIESEFLLVLEGKSLLFKMNQTLYRTASNARAFAHYR